MPVVVVTRAGHSWEFDWSKVSYLSGRNPATSTMAKVSQSVRHQEAGARSQRQEWNPGLVKGDAACSAASPPSGPMPSPQGVSIDGLSGNYGS